MKIAGIVLAGGLSTRMGTNKALLSLQGDTLLSRARHVLQSLDLDSCWISGDYPELPCIPDRFSALGPIGGIYSCACQLQEQSDYLLVLPVDMPYISHRELQPLLNLTSEGVGGAYYDHATFPVLIKLDQPLLDYLHNCLVNSTEKRGRSLYRMVRQLDFVCLAEDQSASFDNTNTPDEWLSCLTRFEHMEEKL